MHYPNIGLLRKELKNFAKFPISNRFLLLSVLFTTNYIRAEDEAEGAMRRLRYLEFRLALGPQLSALVWPREREAFQ